MITSEIMSSIAEDTDIAEKSDKKSPKTEESVPVFVAGDKNKSNESSKEPVRSILHQMMGQHPKGGASMFLHRRLLRPRIRNCHHPKRLKKNCH